MVETVPTSNRMPNLSASGPHTRWLQHGAPERLITCTLFPRARWDASQRQLARLCAALRVVKSTAKRLYVGYTRSCEGPKTQTHNISALVDERTSESVFDKRSSCVLKLLVRQASVLHKSTSGGKTTTEHLCEVLLCLSPSIPGEIRLAR